jgi:TrmH family RNA methyltransferase
MLSQRQKKLIASMANKKFRDEYKLFLAEGPKIVSDLIVSGMKPRLICAAPGKELPKVLDHFKIIEISQKELDSISFQITPQQVLALFEQPKYTINYNAIKQELALVLDGIQDPGNLGTIIRMADWFGINNIICSKDTVDVFNNKVVQATMGALAWVRVHYADLAEFLGTYTKSCSNPVYGTFLEGNNLYQEKLLTPSVIVLGNEGRGIRDNIAEYITDKITIPMYSGSRGSESLNVGVSAAIVCAEFRRVEAYSK